tara:strand:- start:2850 stop:3212 length:363 start_codon:yes stop_codon:yes gene_type:complete
MTVWEDLMNCICQNAPQRPGIQEVLDSLERHTVCTETQCFEGDADAFGVGAPGNAATPPNTMFFMCMMYAHALPPATTLSLRTLGMSMRSPHGGDSRGHSCCFPLTLPHAATGGAPDGVT